MKIILIIFILLSISLISVFFYSWYRLHTAFSIHGQETDFILPADFKPNTQFAVNADNQKIAYWYFPVSRPKAVVILIHGYDPKGGKGQMLGHAGYLNKAGYSTVLLDLRSFGESGGQKITFGVNEWKDAEAVYDFIKSLPENKTIKVGFLGVSMGASTAINTVGITQKGDFIIASVPFKNPDSLFYFQTVKSGLPPLLFYPFIRLALPIELGAGYGHYTPLESIKKVHVPILLISADFDDALNHQDAKDLFDIANSPKEFWSVDAHHDIFGEKPEEFQNHVQAFLNKYL